MMMQFSGICNNKNRTIFYLKEDNYLHSCTETKFECDNYKFVISYNSDSCTVEIICEKLK
mgnify:CR=1 FL=1